MLPEWAWSLRVADAGRVLERLHELSFILSLSDIPMALATLSFREASEVISVIRIVKRV